MCEIAMRIHSYNEWTDEFELRLDETRTAYIDAGTLADKLNDYDEPDKFIGRVVVMSQSFFNKNTRIPG